jgi:hypothetical protein
MTGHEHAQNLILPKNKEEKQIIIKKFQKGNG